MSGWWEGAWPLSGLAEPAGAHLRRGGRPPRVGWETSEPRSACSPNILFTADGSHDSFPPTVPAALPFPVLALLLTLLSVFGRRGGSLQPRSRLWLWGSSVHRARTVSKQNSRAPVSFVRGAVLPRLPYAA